MEKITKEHIQAAQEIDNFVNRVCELVRINGREAQKYMNYMDKIREVIPYDPIITIDPNQNPIKS